MMWSVLTVLCLCLPVYSAVNVIQPYKVVSSNGVAQIQCFITPQPSLPEPQTSNPQAQTSSPQTQPSYPFPVPDELRVTLLKGLHGSQELCSTFLIISEQKETNSEEGEVECRVGVKGGAVELTVSGLTANDTDIYRCAVEVYYPPPYLKFIGNGTLIHVVESPVCPVLDAQSQFAHQAADEDEDKSEDRRSVTESVSAPVIILVVLVMFVLLLIVHLQTLQCIQQRQRPDAVRVVQAVPHKIDASSFTCGNLA